MELIEGVALSNLCDYSFGDQSGQWGNIYTSFMKDANLTNVEFVSKLFEIKQSRSYMTLFIDNIRLYKRHIVEVNEADRPYIDSLHQKNDLLHLCSCFPNMRFIIFTNLEDTPIDNYIFDGKYLLLGEDGANLLSKSKELSFIVEGPLWVIFSCVYLKKHPDRQQ